MTPDALLGVLDRDEDQMKRIFMRSCRDTASQAPNPEVADYIVGIFCATVGEDALTTKESWIKAALEALEDSEVGEGPEERMELADMFADKAFSHCLSAASSWEREPKEGDLCRALLAEDGEWHSAVVKAVETKPGPSQTFTVTFVEYGKDQVVAKGEMSLLQDNDDSDGEGCSDEGTCEMCKRAMPLTRHHLLPRRTHAKLKKKGFSKEKLLSSAYICRPCHNVVHDAEDEVTLAEKYNTTELLLSHPKIRRFVEFNSKQPVRLRHGIRTQ